MVVVARVGGRADGWALLLKQAWVFWVGLSVGWVVSRLPWVNFQELGAGKKREERSGEGQDMRSWRKVGCYLEGGGSGLLTYLRCLGTL